MFETSDPKQTFYVVNQIELFPHDQRILIKLYEPVVGAVAIALYQTLIQDFEPFGMMSQAKWIRSLQEELDCSLRQIFAALHRLEAVGLVHTYIVDNTVNKVIAFRLHKVSSAHEFFATRLLASLLKDKIGIVEFNNLSHEFAENSEHKEHKIKKEKAKDVSASFFEAFNLPENEAISPSADVLKAAQENKAQKADSAQINDRIDWQLIKDQLNIYQVLPSEVDKNKDQIRSLIQSYGLTEQEFVDESLTTLHGKNELDMHAIEHSLADDYRLSKTRRHIQNEVQQNMQVQKAPSDFDKQQQKLWQDANQYSPAEFLYHMKVKKGGFASGDEKRIINVLHSQIGLPTDIVNILIYANLQNAPSVSYRYVMTTANDWLQHKVTDSASAIRYMQKRSQARLQKFNQRSSYRVKKRVEQGTDWSKKKANSDKKINSAELKNFFKNLEDQNGMK